MARLELPPTVHAVLASRIDRLDPDDKRLLQVAAVIGKDVPVGLLDAVADESEPTLHARLARLEAGQLLYETGLAPDLGYRFKHALTHEVAYGTLLHDRRRTLHARIVSAIEDRYADRLNEQVGRLAHHAVQGQLWEKAVHYAQQAGAAAFARSADREAVSWFEQALAALAHLPTTRQTQEQAIDLRFDLRRSLTSLGEFEQSLNYLRQAEDLARTIDDPGRLGWVYAYESYIFWMVRNLTEARALGHRAVMIGESTGDGRPLVAANLHLAGGYFAGGDYRRAERFLRDNVQLLQGDLANERCGLASFPSAVCRSYLAWSLALRGEFGEGVNHAQEALRIAEQFDHPYTIAHVCNHLGLVSELRGDISSYVSLFERALRLCREWDLSSVLPAAAANLAHGYTLSGRATESLALVQPLLEAMATSPAWSLHPLTLTRLSQVFSLTGKPNEALALAERALVLSRDQGERGFEVYALHQLAYLAERQASPDVEAAADRYRQALAVGNELGMRPLVAHCYLGLGKLHRRTGKPEQANEHLTTATTMYREMGMTYWLEQVEREVKELR